MKNLHAYLKEELERLRCDKRLSVAERNQIDRELQRRADLNRMKENRLRYPHLNHS